jgi:hypothetical protein
MNTDNVIKFPIRNSTVKTEEDRITEDAQNFSLEAVEVLHDYIHDKTGVCIYDDELSGLTACLAELVAVIYFEMHGIDHPIKDLVDEIFPVDIQEDKIYTNFNDVNDDKD